jgi:hypothetical protein
MKTQKGTVLREKIFLTVSVLSCRERKDKKGADDVGSI